MLKRLGKKTFEVHLVAFVLMMIAPLLLYAAAQRGASAWLWPLLGLFVLANLLALLVK